jgi:hypothetical protein
MKLSGEGEGMQVPYPGTRYGTRGLTSEDRVNPELRVSAASEGLKDN